MSRSILPGIFRLVIAFGIICGSGWASAQKEEGETRPEILHPSLMELAKLYQELELPVPPRGSKIARLCIAKSIGDVSTPPAPNYSFGLGYLKQTGRKGKWTFWDGLEEIEGSPYVLEPWKMYNQPPKPEEVLHFLKGRRLKSPPNDYCENRSELVFSLHCLFLGHEELANFFYRRCKRNAEESLDKTLVIAAWNYWAEELTQPARDRTVIARKLRYLVEKHQFLETMNQVNHNDWESKNNQKLLDQLDLTLKSEKGKAGTVEAILVELSDCSRNHQKGLHYLTGVLESREEIVWQRQVQIEKRKNAYPETEDGKLKKKIYRMGFASIPPLINHIEDRRLTRTPIMFNVMGGGPSRSIHLWHLGSLKFDVRDMLSAYFPIKMDWLSLEWKAKREDYLDAWERIKTRDELEYAFERLERSEYSDDGPFVSYLLARYPDKSGDFFQSVVRKNPEFPLIEKLTYALIDGELSKEEKIRLLLLGAKSPNPYLKKWALVGLIEIDPPSFDRAYLEIFKTIPKVTDKEEAWSPIVALASLGLASEDPIVRLKVRELATNLPLVAKVNWLERLAFYNSYLNKKATLFYFDFLISDECKDNSKENRDAVNDFPFPDPGSNELRNIAAIQYLKMMNLEYKLEKKKDSQDWARIRTFVRDEIARQLEQEGMK